MGEEYRWENMADGIELWADIYYKDTRIGCLTQCEDDPEFWNYICDYFDLGTDLLFAKTQEEAKEYFIDRLQDHFEDQINYYKEMMRLFETE